MLCFFSTNECATYPAASVGIETAAERRFFSTSRRMPTANAEDPCWSEGCLKTCPAETFPMPPSDSTQPLGVRRRHAPKGGQK